MVTVRNECLNPLSTLKAIEEQLRLLAGKSATSRYFDDVQDSEDVSALLEDLQEVVNDYMVCS